MTVEEKIARLKTLFAQRDEVDKEIVALIGPCEPLPRITVRKEEYRIIKPKNVRKAEKPKTINRPKPGEKKRYYCLDCEELFESDKRKLDAVCPQCNSVHVDYASVCHK